MVDTLPGLANSSQRGYRRCVSEPKRCYEQSFGCLATCSSGVCLCKAIARRVSRAPGMSSPRSMGVLLSRLT